MKISLATKNKIICLSGLCEHDSLDKKCPYYKMIDAKDPRTELAKQIEQLIKTETVRNLNGKK